MAGIKNAFKFILRSMLIIFDKFINVILLGSPHRTISMRLSFAMLCTYVKPRYIWVVPFSNFIDILFHNRFYSIEENHIYNAYEADEILSKSYWQWWEITNQFDYDHLVKCVMSVRTKGRSY